MIVTDEDALICDLAETYHVYDYRSLPLKTAATLSYGLRENSRIKLKINGESHQLETILLALIADRLGFLAWTKTEDAQHGRNRPESILEKLTTPAESESDCAVFDSIEDFKRKHDARMKRGVTDG